MRQAAGDAARDDKECGSGIGIAELGTGKRKGRWRRKGGWARNEEME